MLTPIIVGADGNTQADYPPFAQPNPALQYARLPTQSTALLARLAKAKPYFFFPRSKCGRDSPTSAVRCGPRERISVPTRTTCHPAVGMHNTLVYCNKGRTESSLVVSEMVRTLLSSYLGAIPNGDRIGVEHSTRILQLDLPRLKESSGRTMFATTAAYGGAKHGTCPCESLTVPCIVGQGRQWGRFGPCRSRLFPQDPPPDGGETGDGGADSVITVIIHFQEQK